MTSDPSSALFISPEWRPPRPGTLYDPADLPPGLIQQMISLTATDGGGSFGLLHAPDGGSDTCVFIMHPRTNQVRHYLAPGLLRAGIAVWGQARRHLNNDADMTHEEVLLDVAAAMRMLRGRGFRQIVLLGNSGGASLLGFYQAQASRPPHERVQISPAEDPTGFEREEMPPADLYVALAAHQGEGVLLLGMLDPAVVNEDDPIASDPSLDMFSESNGYRPFPEPSHSDRDWLTRYREAQVSRCRRLDAIARDRIATYREARQTADPHRLDSTVARQALLTCYMGKIPCTTTESSPPPCAAICASTPSQNAT